ncbi:GNAT family N-acetyltransferase [Mucilaginibacter ginsenosidivorans]|uniref:GNAT family N-acetyltransferase n=1 Tax=Mucilaginibacter ginsenosidivorans TaxID=398053 RepID=A0A5B8UU88_9SPHI|nr:GNAT family N-acetyltransferase [Mucilaginibacter ginsenosidivorans]QEC62677.1 GNAT family N-acetyltransferase [Mucilaginibacter ginsenosidivorans]
MPAKSITIKRTEANDPDFPYLAALLNHELHEKYGELQVVYDKFNQISNLDTVVIAYVNDAPAGCGCFKRIDKNTAEIKRMFVKTGERNQGLASSILNELEVWAKEEGYSSAILETANKQLEAIAFYEKQGYEMIPNYGPYVGMETSVCFGKKL